MKYTKPISLLLTTMLISTRAIASEPIGIIGAEVVVYPALALIIAGITRLSFLLARYSALIIRPLIFLLSLANILLGIYFIYDLSVGIYMIPIHGGILGQFTIAIIICTILLFKGIKGLRIIFKRGS